MGDRPSEGPTLPVVTSWFCREATLSSSSLMYLLASALDCFLWRSCNHLRDVACPAASIMTHTVSARPQFEHAGTCWSHRCLRCLHRVHAVTLLLLTFVRGRSAIAYLNGTQNGDNICYWSFPKLSCGCAGGGKCAVG